MAVYVALIEHEPGRSYGVFFPDFPGCVTGGETAEEAMHQAPIGLKLHIESMQADGDPLPDPTPFETIDSNPDYKGLRPFLVEVPLTKGKAIRINITIEEGLLEAIDDFAAKHGKNRSAFLSEAAQEAIKANAFTLPRIGGSRVKSSPGKKQK